jgi:hypothetical protein
MKDKILDIVGKVACILGGLLLLGAVGALECDTYTWGQTLAQMGAGAVLVLGGLAALSNETEVEE